MGSWVGLGMEKHGFWALDVGHWTLDIGLGWYVSGGDFPFCNLWIL